MGDIQEVTEIVTKQEDDKAPITTVTVEETPLDDVIEERKPFEEHLEKAQIIEELPEEISVIETPTKQGPKKTITKKRVLKKKQGRKESITEIVTKQEEGKAPITTVKITETDLPLEQIEEIKPQELVPEKLEETIEELPEHIQVIDTPTEQGSKRTVIKKRTIKKKKGKKEEITEIMTKHEEGQKPETLVTVSEVSEVETMPEELIEEIKPTKEKLDKASLKKQSVPHETAEEFKPELAELLVEFMKKSAAPTSSKTEDEQTTEMVVEDGKAKKQIVKRKVTKKKKMSPDDENIKRLLELEVSKTPLDEYKEVQYTHFKFTYI